MELLSKLAVGVRTWDTPLPASPVSCGLLRVKLKDEGGLDAAVGDV
jgi:hypothetical protein